MGLEEMLELFEIDCRNLENESVTVGGLILDTFGTVPKKGDSFMFKNLKISVRDVTSQRVVRALVKNMGEIPEETE